MPCGGSLDLHLTLRWPTEVPLFTRADGSPLIRLWFVDRVKQTLSLTGIEALAYNSHSFHIGATTTAAAAGISDSLIKTLGRWSSSAYQIYIRIPREELATIYACANFPSNLAILTEALAITSCQTGIHYIKYQQAREARSHMGRQYQGLQNSSVAVAQAFKHVLT